MANSSSRLKAKLDRSFKKAGIPDNASNPVKHGPFAFHSADRARNRMSLRSWKFSKRHPANIAVGQRKCGDELNPTVRIARITNAGFVKACHTKAVAIVAAA